MRALRDISQHMSLFIPVENKLINILKEVHRKSRLDLAKILLRYRREISCRELFIGNFFIIIKIYHPKVKTRIPCKHSN